MKLMLLADDDTLTEVCDLDDDWYMPETWNVIEFRSVGKRKEIVQRMDTFGLADALLRAMYCAHRPSRPTMFVRFYDMHSGGGQKEDFGTCYIEVPAETEQEAKEKAVSVFFRLFNHNPYEDYSVYAKPDFKPEDDPSAKIIRVGEYPAEALKGYVWEE